MCCGTLRNLGSAAPSIFHIERSPHATRKLEYRRQDFGGKTLSRRSVSGRFVFFLPAVQTHDRQNLGFQLISQPIFETPTSLFGVRQNSAAIFKLGAPVKPQQKPAQCPGCFPVQAQVDAPIRSAH